MSLTINTNVASLNAQRNLSGSNTDLATSIQRLSTGQRINSAKDDAAGLAISERFTSQIRGLNQAVRNANDGISLVQTAEGALSTVADNLQRIRELAVQSANATNSADDRVALQAEVAQRLDEIDRISQQTQFNGIKLLDGTSGALTFQVGANNGDTIVVAALGDFGDGGVLAVDTINIDSQAGATGSLATLDTALATVNSARADLGAVQNRFESTIANLQTTSENLSASRGRIVDTDFAAETANLTKGQILQQAGVAMLAQANSLPQTVLKLLG